MHKYMSILVSSKELQLQTLRLNRRLNKCAKRVIYKWKTNFY